MKPQRWHVTDSEGMANVIAFIAQAEQPYTVTWQRGGKRSLSQNALLHRWYDDIAKHYGDQTAMQVKGECHKVYGLPIRLRDEAFAWVWNKVGADRTYEQQCRIFERGIFAMTSAMTTTELKEYMDAMHTHYRQQGVHLTEPEEGE